MQTELEHATASDTFALTNNLSQKMNSYSSNLGVHLQRSCFISSAEKHHGCVAYGASWHFGKVIEILPEVVRSFENVSFILVLSKQFHE